MLVFCAILLGSEREEKPPYPHSITFGGANFQIIKNGDLPIHYIWLHGDEKTAKMALDDHIRVFPGTAFFIQNEDREVPYLQTRIDPNRIFSRRGSYYALKKFKPEWAPGTLKMALDDLDMEREKFFNFILPPRDGLLVAVHNNFRGYNVKYELKHSRRTSIKKKQSPRDFILCTNEEDFEKLASGPYNVVLQDILKDRDDGSLSWELLRRNVRYINIETRLAYRTKQRKMLEFVHTTLN